MNETLAPDSCRISYRYRPSGKHIYRLIPLRPLRAGRDATLVHCVEVQGERECHHVAALQSGFGRLPQRTKFTVLAKEAVRDGCAILDKTYGKRCLFATGTLPGSTDDAFKALAAWSGYLVSRLKQWMADNFAGIRVVWVWEFQKRGALHMHLCLGHNSVALLEQCGRAFHDQWCELLAQISEKSGVDLFGDLHGASWKDDWSVVRTDVQWVEKSVGRYLSKYLSKSAGDVADTEFYAPSRWWGIDNWLRAEIIAQSICTMSTVYSYSIAREIYECITGEVASLAEKIYQWFNIYDPMALTTVLWYPETS